ncbi:PadR family transcriptional regulator [Archaeoglobus sp.]
MEKMRGYLKLFVLHLLESKPMHGYGIIKAIEEGFGLPPPSPGAIYPILANLKRAGLIELDSREEREKKVYCLTEKGRKYLEQHDEERKEALNYLKKLREFSQIGGRELGEVIREIVQNITELNEEQKLELEKIIKDFTKKVKLILLG